MPSARVPAGARRASHTAASSASQLRLLQQRIEEAVMLSVREQLARGCVRIGGDRGELQALGIPVGLQESLDLQVVLLLKHRAGCVQQFTISAQQLPQRIQDALL